MKDEHITQFISKYRIQKIDRAPYTSYDTHVGLQNTFTNHFPTYQDEIVTVTLHRRDFERIITTDIQWELEHDNFLLRHADDRVWKAYEKYITFCNLIKDEHDRK